MSRPAVEAVVINWKRPENVARIVESLRSQSVPCTVTLCDCHPTPEFALPDKVLARVDRVYRWDHNLGAYSRYAPCAAYDHEFTYFTDDDLLPGGRCLEHFLDHAGEFFGVLGQMGRRLKPDLVYRPREVKRTEMLEEVDLVVRAYFIRTRHIGHIANVRWELGQQETVRSEDDIILAVAMQIKAGLGSFLTPHSEDAETQISVESLPSPYALSHRGDHLERRTELFTRARQIGWQPLGLRREPPAVWGVRRRLLIAERAFRHWRNRQTGGSTAG